MPAELSVAQYLPESGNVRHWAFHLKVDGESRIYQIVGEATAFTYGHRKNVDPASSSRFVVSVFVSEIDRDDVESVKQILRKFPIRNDTALWSCQDWVLEALEVLKDEVLIDESSYFSAYDQLFAAFH